MCLKNTRQLVEIDIEDDYEYIPKYIEKNTMCREGAFLSKERKNGLQVTISISKIIYIENKYTIIIN
jgi:hypothetical protein